MVQRFLRAPSVRDITGWSNSTLYDKVSKGQFPRPVKLDPDGRAVAWLETEIEAWQKQRIAERDEAAA
jgi:prophage regulatory protein